MKANKESVDRKTAAWVAAKAAVDAVWNENEIAREGQIWNLRAAYKAREARAARAAWDVYVSAMKKEE